MLVNKIKDQSIVTKKKIYLKMVIKTEVQNIIIYWDSYPITQIRYPLL
jgi:hypothetical protein